MGDSNPERSFSACVVVEPPNTSLLEIGAAENEAHARARAHASRTRSSGLGDGPHGPACGPPARAPPRIPRKPLPLRTAHRGEAAAPLDEDGARAHADTLPGARDSMREILRAESPTGAPDGPAEARDRHPSAAEAPGREAAGGRGRATVRFREELPRPAAGDGSPEGPEARLEVRAGGLVGSILSAVVAGLVGVLFLVLQGTWMFWFGVMRVSLQVPRRLGFAHVSKGAIGSWLPGTLLRRARHSYREAERHAVGEFKPNVLEKAELFVRSIEVAMMRGHILLTLRVAEILCDRVTAKERATAGVRGLSGGGVAEQVERRLLAAKSEAENIPVPAYRAGHDA